ncbi:ATP-binding protein [Noviherbaspirillum sp. Root189]|uniref:ATP-binding protein n=1 Tax=Noviherbaspirillum sp. Root189 TaxID=1736487 RepID=UPI00138F7736|nr:ATP-binding protein [Noviherbaspirillum sp. Root189]
MSEKSIFDLLFAGEGEVRKLGRVFDWDSAPLGHPDSWPHSLASATQIVLDCQFPMCLAWGPELRMIYNDAYVPILSEMHPDAFMEPMQKIWGAVWDRIAPAISTVMNGKPVYFEDFAAEVKREGDIRTGWFTFSYSPLRDDKHQVAGFLCVVRETTRRVKAETRQAFRLKVAEELRSLADPKEIAETASRLLGTELRASRVLYIDIDTKTLAFRAHNDWTDGTVTSLTNVTGTLYDFGPELFADLRAGRSCAVADVTRDSRTIRNTANYATYGIGSLINVPVVKKGRLIAALSVHRSHAHQWTDADVELAEIISEYVWPAVERSRVEKALHAQALTEANRLKELFAAALNPIVVLRGRELVIELANQAFHEWVGRPNLVGRALWEVLPETQGQGFEQLFDTVFETGKPFVGRGLKLKLQRGSGQASLTELYHDVLYQPLCDSDGKVTGIFIIANEVSDAYRANAALRESQERLREGMEAARMVVWDWDLDTGKIQLSDNVSEVLGGNWNWTDHIFKAVHPDDAQKLRQIRLAATPENPRYGMEFRMIRPQDDELIWVENRSQVIFDSNGRQRAVKGVTIDITQRKRSEEELREANRQKDEFLAMLGHELRNPLAPIRAAAELMAFVRLDEKKVRDTSEVIARQVDHMTALIDDLLDVSRVTRGLVALNKSIVDLKHVVSSALEQVGPAIESRLHQLAIHVTPEPARTVGDEKRLIQILANVLNNAAKYTPERGLIELRLEKIEVGTRIIIRDNGIGIPADLQPHVFDLFRQASRTPDRSQGGLGLGLALVKSLMELHGGSVKVQSAGENMGSTFTLVFPKPRNEVATSVRHPHQTVAQAASRPLRALVVDDNQDAARMLVMYLDTKGHNASYVTTAKAALTEASTGGFDVFLLDIGLQDIDGYELARQLRAAPASASALLIAVTGYGQESDRIKALDAGFDFHFVKPVDIRALLNAFSAYQSASPTQHD